MYIFSMCAHKSWKEIKRIINNIGAIRYTPGIDSITKHYYDENTQEYNTWCCYSYCCLLAANIFLLFIIIIFLSTMEVFCSLLIFIVIAVLFISLSLSWLFFSSAYNFSLLWEVKRLLQSIIGHNFFSRLINELQSFERKKYPRKKIDQVILNHIPANRDARTTEQRANNNNTKLNHFHRISEHFCLTAPPAIARGWRCERLEKWLTQNHVLDCTAAANAVQNANEWKWAVTWSATDNNGNISGFLCTADKSHPVKMQLRLIANKIILINEEDSRQAQKKFECTKWCSTDLRRLENIIQKPKVFGSFSIGEQ